MTLSRSSLLRGLAVVALVPACAGEVEVAGDTPLAIVSSDPEVGLIATLTIDGELVRVESVSRDGVRLTSVTGQDGTVHASWHVELSDQNTEGSYGGRPFGRFEDRDSDGDIEAWAEIAGSRSGEVLREVSDQATAMIDDPAAAPVRDELDAVSRLYPSLASLAREEDLAVESTDCYFGYGLHHFSDVWATRYDDHCTFNKKAITCPPQTACTRSYHVAIYRDSDGVLLKQAGNGGNGQCAEAFHQGVGNGSFSWTSKHWDSLNPGGPHWRHASLTCDTRITI